MYRLEVARPRSSSWPWVRRLMASFKTYKQHASEGLEIHSVEVSKERAGELWAVFEAVRGWRQVAVYEDGKLLTKDEAWHRFFSMRQRTWRDQAPPSHAERAAAARHIQQIRELPEA